MNSRQKEVVTKWQVICMVTLILASEGIVTTGYKLDDNGVWLSVIIATVFNIIVCMIYAFILQRNEGKNIFDILISLFGRWVGRLLSVIFVVYVMYLAIIATKSIAIQITDLSLRETPYYYVLLLFMIIYALTLFKGIEVTARISCILFVLIMFTITVSVVLLYSKFELFHFLPMLAAPPRKIVEGGIQNYFIMFGDSALMLGLIISNQNKKKKKNNIFKGLLIGSLIACSMIVCVIFVSIVVLGFSLYNYMIYPISFVLATIDIALFITRIEVLASLFFLTALIIKGLVSMYVATKGLQKIFASKKNTTYVVPVSIIVFIASLYLFDGIEQIVLFRNKYGWIKGVMQVLIPLLVAVVLLFKQKKPDDELENKQPALESNSS